MRKAVEKTKIKINQNEDTKKEINVTISMGLAEYNGEETGEILFERADKALYDAKTNGRNKVCFQ